VIDLAELMGELRDELHSPVTTHEPCRHPDAVMDIPQTSEPVEDHKFDEAERRAARSAGLLDGRISSTGPDAFGVAGLHVASLDEEVADQCEFLDGAA
jgi:hypothetical protein